MQETVVELKPKIKNPDYPRLSASSISTFRQCPRQWYVKYMVGLPTSTGFEAYVGSFIHQIFEDIFSLDPDKRTEDLARKMASERWEEFYDEVFEDMSEAGNRIPGEDELKKYTWDRTHTLWAMEDPTSIDMIKAELKLDVDIEGVHFYGFVDRISEEKGKIIIADYKTGKMGGDSYLPDKLNQIMLYGLAMVYQEGKTPHKGQLIFMRDGIVEVDYDDNSLDEIKKFLLRNNTKIKQTISGSYEEARAKTGPLCEWCQFINMCPEGQEKFAERRAEGRSRPDAPAYKILGIAPTVNIQ